MGSAPHFKKWVEQYTTSETITHDTQCLHDATFEEQDHPMQSIFEKHIEVLSPMTPLPLPQSKVKNCRLFTNRLEMLTTFPKGGVCIEVGTQTGGFAKQILDNMQPAVLHLVDIDYSNFDFEFFQEHIHSKKIIIHKGMSNNILENFPENYFDFIYIDADHAYESVKQDLVQSVQKIKQDGVIVCNDYTIYSPLEQYVYGVPKAVHEILIELDFYAACFALDKWGYHDIALKKQPS